MISYNPKDWFTFIFRFHRADTVRKLFPIIIGIVIYALIIAVCELEWWKLSKDNNLKNITVVHSLLGFVISMLLVFRTNTAYDRWWEGRRLWGSLVNSSRNLALKLSAILPQNNKEDRDFFKKMIPSYALALHHHLRQEKTRIELGDIVESAPQGFAYTIDHQKHIPNQLALVMFKHVMHLQQQGKLNHEQLLFLNAELQSFTDVCGACERIKNTPIPFSYSSFIKKFIFFYVATLPLGFVFSLGYYVVPVTAFIFYVLASLEVIAEEIEDPFGGDANDLPTQRIALNIKKHVEELL